MCYHKALLLCLVPIYITSGQIPPCPTSQSQIGPTPGTPSLPRLQSSCEAGNGKCIDSRCKDCVPGVKLEGLCEYTTGQWRICCRECQYTTKCIVGAAGYFTTYYGKRFNLQKAGAYILTEDCVNGLWSIAIQLESIPGESGAVLASVQIIVDSVLVEITQDGGTVQVNDGAVTIDSNPFTIGDVTITTFTTAFFEIVTVTFLGITVTDIIDGRSLQVIPSRVYKDICGLCGVISDEPSDFTTDPNQQAVQSVINEEIPGCSFYGNPSDVDYCKNQMKPIKDSCQGQVSFVTYLYACSFANCLGGALRSQNVIYDYYLQCSLEKRGKCTQSGHTFYDTFDKTRYQIQGAVTFVLAKDCSGTSWRVDVTHVAIDAYTEVDRVTVTLDLGVIELIVAGKQIKVQGTSVTLPYNSGDTSIYWQDDIVTIATVEGAVKVEFNFRQLVVVDVSSEYYGNTCGLCGVWNDDPSDDQPASFRIRRSTNGLPPGFIPIPNPTGCTPIEEPEARQFCQSLFDDDINEDCNICYDPDRIVKCMYEYCLRGISGLCDYAKEFTQDCCLKGGDKLPLPVACVTTTTKTTTTTFPTTPLLDDPEPRPESSRCYARGDPHYNTFDKKRFNFQGNGTYLQAGDCDGSWSLYTYLEFFHNRPATVVDSIEVVVGSVTVQISKKFVVTINGAVETSFPRMIGDVIIQQLKQTRFLIKFLGVKVWYRKRYAEVEVNSDWYNKTCGLCGRWNEDKRDDEEEIPPVEQSNECNSIPPEDIEYCDKIFTEVADGGCPTEQVNAGAFREDCQFDHCICGDECSTDTVAALIEECYPPRTAECNVLGHTFYKPFDGDAGEYELHGVCEYKLAADDCNGGEQAYGVYVTHQANSDSVTIIKRIDIKANGVQVTFLRDPNAVEVDGAAVDLSAPYNGLGFIICASGNIVTYEDSNVEVDYNFNQMIRVVINEQSYNKTCGLCGTWDDDTTTEQRYIIDPDRAHQAFVSQSWCTRIENPERCTAEGTRSRRFSEMEEEERVRLCEKIVRKSRCDDLSPNSIRRICREEACLCGEECACSVSRDSRDYCFSKTGLVNYSKTISNCKVREPTAPPPPTPDKRPSCTQSEHTFYYTFDGVPLQLQGVCKYILAADTEETWSVKVEHKEKGDYTEVKKVNIVTPNGDHIDIDTERNVKVNGDLQNNWKEDGYTGNGFTIAAKGPFIEWEDGAGIALRYDFEQLLILSLDKAWTNKIDGLCGDFNRNKKKERLMEANLEATHNQYKEGTCLPQDNPETCNGDKETLKQAEARCKSFFNELSCTGMTSPRHSRRCAFSACLCPDCLCAFMRAYRRQCYFKKPKDEYLQDIPGCSGIHGKVSL